MEDPEESSPADADAPERADAGDRETPEDDESPDPPEDGDDPSPDDAGDGNSAADSPRDDADDADTGTNDSPPDVDDGGAAFPVDAYDDVPGADGESDEDEDGDGDSDSTSPTDDDSNDTGAVPTPGTDEYDEWIQGLRDANPDPVAEPDVSTEAPEDGIGGGTVAGPVAATDVDEETDDDGDGDDETTDDRSADDGPPSPPAVAATEDADEDTDGTAATTGRDGPSPPGAPPAEPTAASAAASGSVESSPAGAPGPGDPGFGDPDEPATPPDDEEMPLSDHIEEMVRRLAVVVIAASLATAVAFPSAESLLNAMWYGVLPPKVPSPTLYGPLEKLLSEIKVASLAGILIALPVLVYESYLFMRPGLYPKERRYFLAAVPTSLVLGSLGMAFAYFLILPVLFRYFITYSESAVDALPFGLRVTFDLIVSLLGAFALVFQIPLLIMLAVMIGVVTRRWLEEQRILFWGLFLGIGFFISLGDATGTAPIIIALTMISLFEGTLALLRWTGRN